MDIDSIQILRRRQRIACESCRERKRKCDGEQPCEQCQKFDYPCDYRTVPRIRRSKKPKKKLLPDASHLLSGTVLADMAASQTTNGIAPDTHASTGRRSQPTDDGLASSAYVSRRQSQFEQSQVQQPMDGITQALEGNSGLAFARSLLRTLNPHDVHAPMRMLAWNVFLGARSVSVTRPDSLQEIISEDQMKHLAGIYLKKVQPCYGFTNAQKLYKTIDNAWLVGGVSSAENALLSGIAALALLFSGNTDLNLETKLVALAKHLLDPATAETPTPDSAAAWLLRSVYLRLTAKPEEAWLASCTTMHVVDAAGITNHTGSQGHLTSQDAHWTRRVLDVAHHLNVWMSYDLGRYRVFLRDIGTTPSVSQPGEFTAELLGLLPYSQDLDPANAMTAEKLVAALREVIDRVHTEAPSVMAQCNLMLCIYRRLHTARVELEDSTLKSVVELLQRGIHAVHISINAGQPWHHVANIPFQALCTLLAIDTAESLTVLNDAFVCVNTVNEIYCTAATQEAATTAASLLQLHRLRKETEIKKHSDMLRYYPAVPLPAPDPQVGDLLHDFDLLDSWWDHEFGGFPALDVS